CCWRPAPCHAPGPLACCARADPLVSNWLLIARRRRRRHRTVLEPMQEKLAAGAHALPDRFEDVEHLEEVMTAPSPALVRELAQVAGDLIILGVGGKVGPTLARLARRADARRRIVGVARFSEAGLREKLAAWGIECIAADLLDRPQ